MPIISVISTFSTLWRGLSKAAVLVGVLYGGAGSEVQAQSCYYHGAFGMNFGTVSSSGGSATSSVTYTCAPSYSGQTYYYQICVYIGPGDWSVGQPTRRMTNYNGSFLHYDLFSDPVHTQRIGAPGSTPVYQVFMAVPPGTQQSGSAPIYGKVYAGQAVSAVNSYQEQGLQGLLRYRYDTAAFPNSYDCSTGGSGGGSVGFHSSGVLAVYENNCTVSATDLIFGQVPPPTTARYAHSFISVRCAPGTPWKVSLDKGQYFDGNTRRMAGKGGFVRYELYQNEHAFLVWGDAEADMVAGVSDESGGPVILTVYGEVPPQPDAEMGSYLDTVVVTLHY